ncbi:MAG: AEC family transporter [Patescibacteria group bacterium]
MAFHDTIVAILQLFAVILIGWLIANKAPVSLIKLPEEFWGTLARFVYVVCAPALMFSELSTFDWKVEHVRFAGATAVGSLAAIALSVAVIGQRGCGENGKTMRAISFQPNCVFLGFPLIAGVLAGHTEAPGLASLFAGIEWPIVTIASIWILRQGHAREWKKTLRAFAGDPIIIGCVAGIAWSITDITLWKEVVTPIRWFGSLTSTLALVVIGARLRFGSVREQAADIGAVSAIKLVVIPTLGWIIACIFTLPPVATAAFVLLIGTPVAASTILLVNQHGGNAPLTANTISVSTILSLITLTAIAMALVPSGG